MLRPTYLVYAASLALVGCNMTDKEEARHDDSGNPHYKQAQEDLDNNKPDAAVADYEAALGENPKLAGAHYELGLIYGDKLNDPVGSIYHFRRYLELSPATEKKDQVTALIDKESQAFAASLPNSPTQNADDYARLQSDNAALRKQVNDATATIAHLQSELAQNGRHHGHFALAARTPAPEAEYAPPVPSTSEAVPVIPVSTDSATATPPASNAAPMRATAVDTNSPDVNAAPAPAMGTNVATTPAAPSRSYTVVKGDRVDRIAKKMYGAGHVVEGRDKILAANPGLDPKKLKIGQVLVIP